MLPYVVEMLTTHPGFKELPVIAPPGEVRRRLMQLCSALALDTYTGDEQIAVDEVMDKGEHLVDMGARDKYLKARAAGK